MLVDLAQHRVIFNEGRQTVSSAGTGIARINRIAKRAGVAEIVAGRQRRAVVVRVGNSECEFEVDALVADIGHRGRALGRHDAPAQPVRDEQDQIRGRAVLRQCGTGGERDQAD